MNTYLSKGMAHTGEQISLHMRDAAGPVISGSSHTIHGNEWREVGEHMSQALSLQGIRKWVKSLVQERCLCICSLKHTP